MDLKFGRMHDCCQNLKTLGRSETEAAGDGVAINRKTAAAELTMRVAFWALGFIGLRTIDIRQDARPGELFCNDKFPDEIRTSSC